MFGDMSCSNCPTPCQWLCAIILFSSTNVALGEIPSFASPLDDGSSAISIPETTATGTSVYTIEAFDTDDITGASITYNLFSQVPDNSFVLAGPEGTIVETTKDFDFETGVTEWTLTFSATTSNGTVSASLNVSIDDVNDESPQINGLFTTDIPEEQPAGTAIPTTFTATDADANDVLRYSISGDTSYFDIDSGTGVINVSQALDYDTASQTTFDLVVTVRDAAGHTVSQPITVNLLNINDNAPTFINALAGGSGTVKNITETTPTGASIYRIEADDADGDVVSIDLVAQAPASMFTFDGTTLQTTGLFDFETGPKSFELTFNAASAGDTSTATLTVNIDDVNDEVPQITGQLTVSMDEEQPVGTVVPITMNVVDGDAADTGALIYSISGDDNYFDINATTGEITTTNVLDFDVTSSKRTFSLTLTVRDSAGHTAVQPITVTLLNINDNAPTFINTLDSGSGIKNITETTPKDTSIYRIEAEDADGDAVSIDLVAQIPTSMFTFDGTTLWTTDVFDYETGPIHFILTFNAASAGDTSTATLTVNIEDVNDEVPQITGQFTVFMDEEQPVGTVVPITMNVVDGDAADTGALIYSISGDDNYFDINATTGEITTTNILDFDATSSKRTFSLTLTVRDTASHTAVQPITVTLLNINDNAPAFINTLDSGSGIKNITETTPKDTSIYRIEAEDADGDAVSIDLVAQIPAGMFTFDGTTLWTTDVFDYETGPIYFTLTFDATSSSDTSTATLTVIIEDVNDEVPQLTGQFTVSMDEEQPAGTVVPITMNAIDGDVADADALIYSISGDDAYFEINTTSGVIKTTNVLDYDSPSSKTIFSLTLTIRDTADHTVIQPVTVNLLNINDNEPVFLNALSSGSDIKQIPETTEIGTFIYKIEAEDADEDIVSIDLVEQTPAGGFTFDGTTLTTAQLFDFETGQNSFTLTFNATASGDVTTAVLTVDIHDTNDEIPQITGQFTITIDEEQPADTEVPIAFTVVDTDAADTNALTYSITGDDLYFKIEENSGVITTRQVLDYEELPKTLFGLTMSVRDTAGHVATQLLTINLRNLNDNLPVFESPAPDGKTTKNIPETSPQGEQIYNIQAFDADNDVVGLAIADQDPPGMFDLSGSNIVTAGTFDYETGPTVFTLTLNATSEGDTTVTKLTINIDDENDETPTITGTLRIDVNEDVSKGTVIPVQYTVEDADQDDVLRYSISGDNKYFETDPSSGEIKASQLLDYDTLVQTTFHTTLMVTDDAGHWASATITINLLPVNDNSPIFIKPHPSGIGTVVVPETKGVGSDIYSIEAEDGDGDMIVYELDDPSDMFTLVGTMLRTKKILDFESQPMTYTLTFSAISAGETATASMTVSIQDENDNWPIFVGTFTAEIDEELPEGSLVPSVFSVSDADADDVLRYTMSGDGARYFSINHENGEIRTAQVLDFESMTTATFFLTVTVTDLVDHETEKQIAITLRNINDNPLTFTRPLSSGGTTVSVSETASLAMKIYTLEAEDVDGGDIGYQLISQDPSDTIMFRLNGDKLSTDGAFDFESGPRTYTLTFNASTDIEWTTAVLTVLISDENDEFPEITGTFTADLIEEQPIGATIPLTISATDADDGDELQFSLSGADSNVFDIDPKTGVISTKERLDYDTATKTAFEFAVVVTDSSQSADHSVTQTVTINLIGINDNSPEFSPVIYYTTIQENTAEGTQVVGLTVSDADGDPMTLSIASGDFISDRKFQLVDKAIQTTSSAIDYESLTGQDYGYTLTVTATDDVYTATAAVYITITGENEYDPVWATFDLAPTLAENALIGTTVLTILASDQDEGPDGFVKYTIDSISPSPTGRPVDGLFHLDEDSGVITTKSGSFDRDIATEGVEYYDIVVRATDMEGQGRSITETVRVTLTDVNDNKPKFSEVLTLVEITEADVPDKVIQELEATDADALSSLTYHLDGSSSPSSYSNYFAIEELNKLKLKSLVDLDQADSVDTFHLVVIVKDGGNPELSGTTTVLVTVTAVNENSPVFAGPYTIDLSENTNVDTDVVTVIANDADSGVDGMVTYSIEAGDPDNEFSLDPSTGVIKLAKSLDYESKTQHVLTVRAADGGTQARETTTIVTINILDENDNLPTCDEMSIVVTIPESRGQGDSVTQVTCDDADTDTVSYRIKSGDATVFEINSDSGLITLLRAVDYDAGETYFHLVIGVDSGSDSLEVIVAITVSPVNEHPPIFNIPDVLVLSEDVVVGTTISSLMATDLDAAPHGIVEYQLASVSNTGGSLFSISHSTGVLRLIDSLDYEAIVAPAKQYVLQIVAIDGGTPALTGTGTLTVSIQDINDNLPECDETSYTLTLAENTAIDYVLISDFGCFDDDAGTVLQYSLDPNSQNDFRLDDAATKQLVLDAFLNFDVKSSYNVLLTVSDGVHNTKIDIDISITDVNDGPPVFPQTQYTANIPETANVGTSVITILATDPDADTSSFGKLIYTLTANPGLKFNIDPSEGQITLAGIVDAEQVDEYILVIEAAEEAGDNTATATCTMTIDDVNDNKPTCAQYSFSVSLSESQTTPVPKVIYTLNCDDKDSTSVLQYTVASGDVSLFEMNQNALQLVASIDYEAILTDSYEIVVSVSDGDFSVQVSGVITITGVNEFSPVFNPATYQVTRAEDTALSSTIVTVSATDGDRGETVTYSLLSTFDEFKIEPSSGDIILVANLDRETTGHFELVVRGTDGNSSVTATVAITVSDVNDHTPTFSPSSYSITIPENTAADQSVTTVTAIDHDDPTGPGRYGFIQYSLVDTFNAFKIDPNSGQISTTVQINYEEATFYTLTVIATDSNYGLVALSSSALVTVMVTGINEHEPKWAEFVPAGTEFSMAEDSAIGNEIVTLSATDEDDGIHGVVFYTIDKITTNPAGRPISGLFHLDQVSGKLSTTSNAFDRDVNIGGTEYYDIVVKATDQEFTTEETIRVVLTDVNDNSPIFTEAVYNVEISEEDAADSIVTVVTATDADETAIVTYVLDTASSPSAYSTYFTLDGDTIKLQAIVDLDPPTSAASTFHLVVLAKDGGTPEQTGTTTVIVSVKASNEGKPTFAAGPHILNDLSETIAVGEEVITLVANDNDYGSDGVVTYTIVGGDPDSHFSIHPTSGKVKVAKALDYERKGQFQLTIEAKDGGNPQKSSSTTLSITLQDESDSVPTCQNTLIYVTVLETYIAGDQVAELSCDDEDLIDTLQYGIKSGDTTIFQVDSTSGVVTLKRDLDYDEQGDGYFELVIGVAGGADSIDVTVSITVSAVNEFTPNFTDNNVVVQFSENAVSGTTVATMEASDGDSTPHDIIRYSISSVTNGGSGLFAVSKESGIVRIIGSLDYETMTDPKEYVLKIQAVDGGGKTGTGTLTVSVIDENDNVPACAQTSYTETIPETTALDTKVVPDFGCTDDDAGTTLSYTLSQTPSSHFRIETTPVTRLLVDDSLNFDTNDHYTLTLSVSDGQHTTDINIDIVITDINIGGPVFDKVEYTGSVSETASAGTSIVTVSATDPDATSSKFGQLVYTLIENSENKFNVDPDTGKITLAWNLDAEDTARYILIVKVAEIGGINTATASVNVTVEDENDNEPECSKYSFSVSVPETSSGDLLTLDCDDKDITEVVLYSISEGDTSLFQMNQNVLQLLQEIDYDTSPTDTYVVVIDVSDGSNVVQVSGIITVTAVNENAPSFTEGTYQVSKAEDIAQGATIIKVTATDPDKGDTIQYSLASPNTDDFSVDESTGEVIILIKLDRETQDSHELIIHASDRQFTATATIEITVTDVNDHTPTFQATSYSATVPENEASGYSVISVSASDLDDPNSNKYGEVRYYITNTNDAFVIDSTSGEITTIKSLDYEDTPTYTIFVKAIDSSGGPSAKSSTVAVTIKVENVNEDTPTFNQDTYSQSVPENTPVGTQLVPVFADDSDADAAGQVVYTMPTHNFFYLTSKTGEISLKSPLDYETADKMFVFEVVATDSAISPKSSTSTVSISVSDINDNEPKCDPNLQTMLMPEDAVSGTNIAELTCTDSDSNVNAELAYIIALVNNAPSDGTFSVDSQGRLSLATGTLDYEMISSYSILVSVSDGGIPPLSSTATIKLEITDINEHSPVFDELPSEVTILENVVSSDAIIRIQASDQDTADTITYYFDPENAYFEIDRDNGNVFAVSTLDYEALGLSKSLEIIVYAADNGSPVPKTSSTTVTIIVQDENDGTPIFAQGVYYGNVSETSTVEITILQVLASDSDGEQLAYAFDVASDTFRIEQTGDIVLDDNSNLDYDVGPKTYRLVVHAEDPRSRTGTATVYIIVLNENEHDPAFSDFDRTVSVREDAKIDDGIIIISASDDDDGVDGELTYEIISGYDGKFAIDKQTGQITVSGPLDREAQTVYVLTISALDGGLPQKSIEDTLTINILDVNDVIPSCEKQLYSLNIPENTTIGSTVLPLICSDGDDDPNRINNVIGSYIITDGNTAGKFELTQQGEVQLKDTVDRETLDAYTLTVEVADTGVPALTTTVTLVIQITDVNDNDPSFDQDNYLFDVSEFSSVGHSIGSIHATDLDVGDAGHISYQINNGNEAGKFAIDEGSGEITLVDSVDFDSGDHAFNLDIAAVNTDGSGLSSLCLVAIQIQDENDNRPNCSQLLYTASIAENVPVTTDVIALDCGDIDSVGNSLEYTIESGNDAGYFDIGTGSGNLFIAQPLDAETVQTAELIVETTDGTFITSVAITITIIDINEYPPSMNPVNAMSIPENVPVGTILYTLTTSDADISEAEFSYTITGGDPDQQFSVGTTSGDIQLHKALDRELVDSYVLTVQVADGIGADALFSDIEITFNIDDVNDNYPLCEQTTYTVSLPENSAGQVIILPVCADADTIASPMMKYEIISGNEDGIFSINEDTGQIDLIGNLDYETKATHELRCEIDDQGNPSNFVSTISVIVHVEPINEYNPQFTETETFDVIFDENTPVGTSVTEIKAFDNDTGVDHADIRFSISNGNTNNVFAINPRTGVITLVKSLDYESVTDYSLTVTAKDSVGSVDALSADFVVHINLNDVNDITPQCSPALVSETHDEDLVIGSVVAQLQCTDNDASSAFNTLSYNIISINGDTSTAATGQFSVSTSGIVTLKSNFNYEENKYVSILTEVADGGFPVLLTTATVELTINDVNEHDPAFELPAYSANLKETTQTGTLILSVKANDGDEENIVSYLFEPQVAQFEIDSRTGNIYLVSRIDYDTMGDDKTILLTVIAKDDGDNIGPRSSSVEVTITVVNENDGSPVFIPGVYTAVISENQENEDTVTTVTASDIDDTDLDYFIISGNDDNVFRIDKIDSNGAIIITDNTLLDYETRKSYSLVVHAVDAGGLTGTTTVAIDVTGYNEFVPQLNSLSSTQLIPENSEIGHSIIDLDATDDDQGPDGVISYTITSGGTGKFAIDPTSGLVTVAGSLDREEIDAYTIEITVADKGVQPGSLSVVYTLTVSVMDENDISPVCTSSYYSVSIKEEIAPGTSIAQLDCTDGDAETPNNEITTYVITSGNEDGEFLISPTGEVSTDMALDYETKHYYELVIDVSDSGIPALTTTTILGVTVSDENDNPPQFTENPYGFEAPEDTPVGSSVGQISASDADVDSAGEMLYSILSGNDDGTFALDRTAGILYVAKALDYDVDPKTYTLVVRATDRSASPLFDTSTIQFIIRDVNDQQPVCSSSLYSAAVPEDASFQTSVITVICDDIDTIGDVAYSIIDGNVDSVFIINENTGLITVAKENVLDTETLDTYDLTIQTSDGTFGVNATVVISITDVNDIAPVFVPAGPYQFDMSEHAPIGHTIVDLDVSDGDSTPSVFTFSILSGNEEGKFKVGPRNGILQLQREVDREELISPVFNLEVTVADGLFTATAMVNINVLDENDNYVICDQVSYTAVIPETTVIGSTVFEPECTDPDSTTDMHFVIVSGNEENKFLVDEDDGKLKLQSDLDYETTTSYTITITVADQGTPSLTTTLLMSVFVDAENEHKPEIFGNFNVSVYEDAPINQVIVSLFANDSDVGLNHASITYAIKHGNTNGLFNIHPSTGIVTLVGRLDYETVKTHILTITATDMSPRDAGRRSAEEILTIHVLDVNDNYPLFDPQVYAIEISENTLVGTTIAALTATDADSGLAGTNGLQFNIIKGNIGNAFSLSGSELILDIDVDTETVSNYILIVSASDQGNPMLSSNTIVSIYIKPVNEHTPVFSLPNDTVSVDESITVGELIYQLTATDDDTGIYSELRYYIRSGNIGDAFTVDLYNGAITLATMLDYEVHSEPYVLQLEVEDMHKSQLETTRTGTMTLTVILNDINDEIPIFSQTTYTPSIRENIADGTRILTVIATDKDTGPNGDVTYQIVAGTGTTLFEIDSVSGAISTRIASTIDYETRSSYDLIVVAEDNGIPKQSSSALVHITILDLNDETPTFEVFSFVTTILEEEPIDTFLTSVVAVDKDSVRDNNNVFTYSFSEASAEFRIDQASGDIYTTAILDRETVSSYTLLVYAIDQGPVPNTGSTTVNVQVIDINDNAPEIAGIYDTTVSEDAITNTAVFIINALDKDSGENGLLNYSIIDGNIGGDFKIDPGTGFIQVHNTLDRERTSVYHLEITVTDGGTPSKNAIRSATVTISDINDNNPIFDQTTYRLNVSEDVPVNTPVGRVTATDADIDLNAALRYMIGPFSEGDSNHFKVDGGSGVIRTSGLLDREIADTYVFIYRAIDGGSNALTASTTVSITIGDFDDQIPEFENFFYSAHSLENQPIGTSILTVVTSDKDFGPNAEITLTIDTKTVQGVRANEFIAVDSSTSTLSVRKQINRETDESFEFILIATDGGASPLTATATVYIIIDDENDERPAFSPTYYNAEIAYNDDCAVTVTTLSASDKDYGVNAEFKYRFTLNPAPQLFKLEESTGDITLLATAAPYAKYKLYAEATDAGSPPLTSNGVTIRIDTFTPNDHVISFNLGITEATFLTYEQAFLNQLSTVFRLSYPTATVKRWCIGGDIADSKAIVTQVHLYVVKNNRTDTEASIEDIDKEFLSSTDAFAIVSADEAGSPANDIKGSAWEIFDIVSVEKYYVEPEDETPFFQTGAGVAIIVLIVLLLVAAIAVGVIFLLRKAKKHNWLACLNQVEHGEDDGGDHVARNQYLTKTYEKKPLPPIGYYDKSNLPPPVVALPMPSSTKKVPLQVQSQIYERPKDMHIYSDLIGFRPGSGVGSRLMKHPEKLRSGSPASSAELPPIRKLSSLVSRPPTFAPPIRDVSLREETPRAYDDSMRTIDDETASLSTTKEYDGRAVDPVTGRVYEYSTRTHERRWVNESENDSHFKLKTEEK